MLKCVNVSSSLVFVDHVGRLPVFSFSLRRLGLFIPLGYHIVILVIQRLSLLLATLPFSEIRLCFLRVLRSFLPNQV